MSPPLAGVRISVVIPTHHRRELVLRLLHSLTQQTLAPDAFEVVVVHNHTDDGTEQAVSDWCEHQPFSARYLRRNFKGPGRSRADGARLTTGAVIAYIDDDCVAAPGWLAFGLAMFDRAAADGRPLGLLQGRTVPMQEQPPRFPFRQIAVPGPTPWFETCNIFYRREAYHQAGGFSEEYLDTWGGEDTDLGWKVIEQGYETDFCAEALVRHEVFTISLRQWLTEPLRFAKVPPLVAKHPGLRSRLHWRYFLNVDSFLFNGLVLALLLLPFSALAAAVLASAYVLARYFTGSHVGSPVMRLARIAMGVPRGAVAWWALVRSSIASRTLLL